MGDRERRAETNYRVHRERNHDDAFFSSSDVDIRREDRKQLEKDPVAKREDSIYLFDKHTNGCKSINLYSGCVSSIRLRLLILLT